MIMNSFYFKVGGCVFFVLLFFVGVVVFWPGGGSEPVEKEAGQAKADAEAKRVSSARPSIRDIERIRARQTGFGAAARANPEADTLFI